MTIWKCTTTILLLTLAGFYPSLHAQKQAHRSDQIIVELAAGPGYWNDSLEIEIFDADHIGIDYDKRVMRPQVVAGLMRYLIQSLKPVIIRIPGLTLQNMYEPGDSIRITGKDKGFTYSGIGVEKFLLMQAYQDKVQIITAPANPVYHMTTGLPDFMECNDYLNKQIQTATEVLKRHESAISRYAYHYLKGRLLSRMEDQRLSKFARLAGNAEKLGVSRQSLCKIFDEIWQNDSNKWLLSMDNHQFGFIIHYYKLIRYYHRRKNDFIPANTGAENEAKRKIVYYELAPGILKGNVLENYLAYLISEAGINELGFKPEIETLLKKYYARKSPVQFVDYVKKHEAKRRMQDFEKGFPVNFELTDKRGDTLLSRHLSGKIVLIDLGAVDANELNKKTTLPEKVRQAFQDDTMVVLAATTIAGNKRSEHPLLNAYEVLTYPMLSIRDAFGKMVNNPLPNPETDSGQALIELVNTLKQAKYAYDANNFDGPYVFHVKDSTILHAIVKSKLQTVLFKKDQTWHYTCRPGNGDDVFSVQLGKELSPEPSVYDRAPKLFVVSDIEGDFAALKQLLYNNKIIDKNFNWTFGKGHLVFSGDLFDRGEQVTECLWLIYSLEEKAKAAGGYVHFILGNHEIMNLQGDFRYVQQKYKDNADLMGRSLSELYGENTELGRWLRTKNIVERIDDILFCHAGISPELNKLDLSIEEINQIARPFYASRTKVYTDEKLKIIMGTKTGPYWYRGYYKKSTPGTMERSIDSILHKFNAQHIVTGHTIVADTISVHYGGKVINTDTPHAKGLSEALLIEGNRFYRVNAEGRMVLLFTDEKRNLGTPR